MEQNEYILIGKIIGTFGIKGELKVYSESDFIDYRFKEGASIFIKIHNNYQKLTITSFRIHQKTPLIKVNNLNDINQVEKMVGLNLFALSSDYPPLEEDEYYLDDLIGLCVYDENHHQLGIVNDVLEVPQGYILEVKSDTNKMLIPFVDEYILEIACDHIVVKAVELCP